MLEWSLFICLALVILALASDNKKLQNTNYYYNKYIGMSDRCSKLESIVEDQEKIISMQKKSLEQYEKVRND